MLSANAARVLAHHEEHGALPRSRDSKAYVSLLALRKQHAADTLPEEDAQALAVCGPWQLSSRPAHNRGKVGPDQKLIFERVEALEAYILREQRLPPVNSRAGRALNYLKKVADDIPASLGERLDALMPSWRPRYKRSDAVFAATLDELQQWRVRYPRRWPRNRYSSDLEQRLWSWLRAQRKSTDPDRLRQLDERVPGWREEAPYIPSREESPFNSDAIFAIAEARRARPLSAEE